MYNNISDWDRMVAGKLYNSASRDIFLSGTLSALQDANASTKLHCGEF
ncbi:MAG: hypothetical protein L6V88_09030 [Anaerotruncus sp.]|nr:MAG: hypothetical protein L6V88_09030 [Anaerotruncus sp.]